MDYAEELRALLRPLGIYDADGGIGGAELSAVGDALTDIWEHLESAEREALPVTAEDEGLAAWESLLPFAPHWLTLADRRRAVSALMRIDGTSFTPAALNATVAGCGIRAMVEETDTPMTVVVSFPYNRGEPDDFARLRRNIEQILPCHLDVTYYFVYVTWEELEALFATWADAESAADSWRELERAGGEAA